MKASEVRIGNWIRRGSLAEGFQIDSHSFVLLERHPELYKPIPVTPSVLSQCGFMLGEKWFVHQCFYKGQFEICISRNKEVKYGNKTEHGFDTVSHQVEYLHQLQNLYYAITGTELIIDFSKNYTDAANKNKRTI